MATQSVGVVGQVGNTFEYLLEKAGLTEPVTTYLSDPIRPERIAAGFMTQFLGPFTNIAALETAYPSATYPGCFARVGAAAPYLEEVYGAIE